MTINFVTSINVVFLQQQYTPRDRFLVIGNTASQGVSFAFIPFLNISLITPRYV